MREREAAEFVAGRLGRNPLRNGGEDQLGGLEVQMGVKRRAVHYPWSKGRRQRTQREEKKS